jgi:hypothetical protein
LPLKFWKEDKHDPMLRYFPTVETHSDARYVQMEVYRRKFLIYVATLYFVNVIGMLISLATGTNQSMET